MEHYPRLVRLAYLILPAGLGRHRRVLLAHRLAQRTLPRSRRTVPGSIAHPDPAYALLRQEVVRGALGYGRPLTGWRRRLRSALVAAPLPPIVVGLRLFPPAGGAEELALDHRLARLDAPARAAYALRGLEELGERDVAELLGAAGVSEPLKAVREAASAADGAADARLLTSAEFDPCTVQARPTDLVRRRQHMRAGSAAAAAVAIALVVFGMPGSDDGGFGSATPEGAGQSVLAQALDPAKLVRAAPDAWLRSSRLDFSAWPARGNRVDDTALLRRALDAWAQPGASVHVSVTPGTAQTPPTASPQLLFAGDVDGAAVVLMYDGMRIVRYAEPDGGNGGGEALDFARVDGAWGSSASAVVIDRSDSNARYLTAPWVTGVQLRDLLKPDASVHEVKRSVEGVTGPVPGPVPASAAASASASAAGAGAGATSDGACGTAGVSWPVMQLTPHSGLPGLQPFLLTDLGDLTPVHLTYATGDGTQQGEATGQQALASWAHSACRLDSVRGEGVRSVSTWDFADQQLPEGGGSASWLCTRADTWAGTGHVLIQFLPPGAAAATPASVVAGSQDSRACGRYSPDVLSGALWKAPSGRWYLLAAGSAGVQSISATGGLQHSQNGRMLAVPAQRSTHAQLSAGLSDGSTLPALR